MRYSKFFEVGFMQALAECAKSTFKGPLTANPVERPEGLQPLWAAVRRGWAH